MREHDRVRVHVGEERRGRQQVVVERAVVERPRERRRSQERHLAVADPVEEDQELVALVRVPLAAEREAGESRHDREDEDADEAQHVLEADAAGALHGCRQSRAGGDVGSGRGARRGRWAFASAMALGSLPSGSAGALRPFALRVANASGGRSPMGSPAASAFALAMFTAS